MFVLFGVWCLLKCGTSLESPLCQIRTWRGSKKRAKNVNTLATSSSGCKNYPRSFSHIQPSPNCQSCHFHSTRAHFQELRIERGIPGESEYVTRRSQAQWRRPQLQLLGWPEHEARSCVHKKKCMQKSEMDKDISFKRQISKKKSFFCGVRRKGLSFYCTPSQLLLPEQAS